MKINKSLQIAVTYIGAVIGAGFASGQEILQFFVIYGSNGLLGIIFSGLLFIILGLLIVQISHTLKSNNYKELFYSIAGKKFGFIADLILTLFLLGSLIVMLAGSKEIFNQFFNYKINFGLILTIIVIIWSNYYGVEGIMKLNLILIPLLLVIIVAVLLGIIDDFRIVLPHDYLKVNWIASSFIYTGYNLILALTVLVPLSLKVEKEELFCGISMGGIVLGTVAFFLYYLLYQFYNEIVNSQIPIIDIIAGYKYDLYYIYSSTLWLAMLTTASCNLYALTSRLNDSLGLSERKVIFIILIFVFPFVKMPFSKLVELIYPQLGKLSLGLLLFLIFSYVRNLNRHL
ncbi:putative membrane protein YkvI [Orenia metallireducens]|uniref:Uncharacterized membrane protein YkvI n=1 Tax=Orenia metallireducens TaxID=1413210 RepID=A0A285G3H6_9FIRM|nr:hypothetical protein [Orenia metallireducens]PRX31839.1 putative membrane protein YkvI [Orenia metallireducens]SNY17634.1 Uncharacterized membrane protein YkvI [Orenia metallireducens]